MNKGELIEKLSKKLGDQKTSSRAVDAVVSEIENAVSSGEKVNITGFGVFEKRDRAARTARNPRTGEPIQVRKHTVPAFRPGASFKSMVAGNGQSSSRSPRAQTGRGQSAQAHTTRAPRGQSAYAQHKGSASVRNAPSGRASRMGAR
jgi:DNA-binding protein HU-beta